MKTLGVAIPNKFDYMPEVHIAVPSDLSTEQWASACADRLIELRPGSEPESLRGIAREMALTLGYFDPAMAAEMEHEGGMLDD